MIDEKSLVPDGNTLKFIGDLQTLPVCPLCKEGKGEKHELLTQEHPYKLIVKEEVTKEGESHV